MKQFVLVCIASIGLLACSAEEQPPPPPAPTEVPLTDAEEALVNERIAAVREAADLDVAREALQKMDNRYSVRMRDRVNAAYSERYRQAVTDADTEEELEPLRKLAPDLSARLHFNGRWIELRNDTSVAKK